MQDLIDYLYDMHVSADIKIEELAEDIISIVNNTNENKPIKIVFDDKPITVVIEENSNAHFEKEALKRITEKVKAASDDNICRLYLPKKEVDVNE